MLPEIMGYRRPDGRFGIRNHIAVIATMDNANPTVRRICSLVKGCVPFCPGFGRGEMNEDLALHNLLSINTALHPNVYGVIVVALEDQTAEYISGEIAKGGKPVVGFSIEDQGGTVEVAYRAAQAAIQMLHDAGRLRPEPMPWSEFVLGVECGGSDGSSGIVSNPVTGRLADRVIDAGGTVIMSETLELLGGEEMLGRRAVTPEVAAKVKGIIQRTLDYAAEHNLDIMGANPAPDNIAGGLTTIEEKALGAIKKGGTRPLVEVLEEGERPTKKGFVIMDATAIVSGGCHAVIFSTGKGNCIGHPVAPVIKISGNPMTVKAMRDNIDVDVSGVINQGLTLDQATDIVQDKLVDVCWGAMTSSDMLGEIETAASRLLRTL